jgi:hypothetical protein
MSSSPNDFSIDVVHRVHMSELDGSTPRAFERLTKRVRGLTVVFF